MKNMQKKMIFVTSILLAGVFNQVQPRDVDAILERMRKVQDEMNQLFDELANPDATSDRFHEKAMTPMDMEETSEDVPAEYPELPKYEPQFARIMEVKMPAMEMPQVTESDTATVITVRLPDYEKDKIKVAVQVLDGKKFVVISARKIVKKEEEKTPQKGSSQGYFKTVEKSSGQFEYRNALRPFDKDKEITSKFENGVLTVTIPVDVQKRDSVKKNKNDNARNVKVS